MIDRKWVGHVLPASVLPIERTRLQFFARAIGETDPVYTDADAARAAGHADLPAPPTFLFAAELDSGLTFRLLDQLQIPIAKLLHGEQRFVYHREACVGDTVTVCSTITDIYDKKGGALWFVVQEMEMKDQAGKLLAKGRGVTVVRNPDAAKK